MTTPVDIKIYYGIVTTKGNINSLGASLKLRGLEVVTDFRSKNLNRTFPKLTQPRLDSFMCFTFSTIGNDLDYVGIGIQIGEVGALKGTELGPNLDQILKTKKNFDQLIPSALLPLATIPDLFYVEC